jgi:Na+-driven multidrug efflux pump
MVKNALAVGMMLMVVSSALVYSVGQVLGAETRARASVWATSMFNGAIIAALIYLLVPFVLRTMLAGSIDTGSIAC